MIQQFHFWDYISETSESRHWNRLYNNVHSTISIEKMWKQPECPSMDGQINKTWSIHYSGIFFSLKKGRNSDTFYNIYEP